MTPRTSTLQEIRRSECGEQVLGLWDLPAHPSKRCRAQRCAPVAFASRRRHPKGVTGQRSYHSRTSIEWASRSSRTVSCEVRRERLHANYACRGLRSAESRVSKVSRAGGIEAATEHALGA